MGRTGRSIKWRNVNVADNYFMVWIGLLNYLYFIIPLLLPYTVSTGLVIISSRRVVADAFTGGEFNSPTV